MLIESVEAVDTHDLRRRVLREGHSDAEVDWDDDRRPAAFHLAVRSAPGSPPVAVATFIPDPTPFRRGQAAWRLRGMAVEEGLQRRGFGRRLVAVALERLAGEGADVCWANARDTALGFYVHLGFAVCGHGFVLRDQPHHVVLFDLASQRPGQAGMPL